MNPSAKLAYLFSGALLSLCACGTSTLGGGDGGGGTNPGTSGTSGTGGNLCVGPNPGTCFQNGCPDGSTCVNNGDPKSCYSTNCECVSPTIGWGCDADCFPGTPVCIPSSQVSCGGVLSPVSCASTGCASGFTCTPDADPTVCHPGSCTCDGSTWTCDHGCVTNGSTCVAK